MRTFGTLKRTQDLLKDLNKNNIIADKGKGIQHVKVQSGYVYDITIKDGKTLNTDFSLIAKKVKQDLEVLIEDNTTVVFDNYFEVCSVDLSCLVALPIWTHKKPLYWFRESWQCS